MVIDSSAFITILLGEPEGVILPSSSVSLDMVTMLPS